MQIWNVAQSGENEFTATYEVHQHIKEGDQTKAVNATYTVTVHVDADGNMIIITDKRRLPIFRTDKPCLYTGWEKCESERSCEDY